MSTLTPADPDTALVVSALGAAYFGLDARRDEPTVELRGAIGSYVAGEKRKGLLAEQIIIRLKLAMAAAGLSPATGEREIINNRVITFCIHQYYGD